MASITWTCVFIFLIIELVTTFILVVPVPRRIRNMIARKLIFRFHLGDSFSKAVWFIAFALVLALVESYNSTNHMLEKLGQMENQDMATSVHGHGHHHHHDKQKLYKAERNMYLAGFALTLLFVIGRILKLMQESVELEDELDFVRKPNTVAPIKNGNDKPQAAVETAVPVEEKKKPDEKKKD